MFLKSLILVSVLTLSSTGFGLDSRADRLEMRREAQESRARIRSKFTQEYKGTLEKQRREIREDLTQEARDKRKARSHASEKMPQDPQD